MNLYAIWHFLEGSNTRYSERRILREFKEVDTKPRVLAHRVDGRVLRYTEVNPVKEPEASIVFVHGAPGGTEAFFPYLKDPNLFQRYRMVSVDRLGYGGSGLGWPETSIVKQAEALQPIVDELSSADCPLIIVGHSFGGPISAQLAMQNPGRVDGLLLLAPAIDPDNERSFWVTRLGKFPPTRWMTPVGLRVAADEKWVHIAALREMVGGWKHLTSQVVLIHGTNDMIVPFENLAFAKRLLPEAQFRGVAIEGANHFIPWSKRRLITQHLVDLADRLK